MTPITTGTDRMAQMAVEGHERNERSTQSRRFQGK